MAFSTPVFAHLWNPETRADLFPLRKRGMPWLTYRTGEILTDYVQLVTLPEIFVIVLYLRVYFLSVMRFRWAPNLKRFVVVVVLLRGRSLHAKTRCTFSPAFSYDKVLFYYVSHELVSTDFL